MDDKVKIMPQKSPPLDLAGISLEFASKGERVKVSQRGYLTSLDSKFHGIAEQMCRTLNITPCWNLLVRWNEKETLIFCDNLPITLRIRSKEENIKKGQFLYRKDIADITSLSFKDYYNDLNPKEGEKVFCIISKGYLHGIYYDFTGDLNLIEFQSYMGELYKQLEYPYIYNSLEDGTIDKMIENGWFPFVELLGDDCEQLIKIIEEKELSRIPKWCQESFSEVRIKKITDRWKKYSAYQRKRMQFEEGIQCFYDQKFIAAISTLTPLVEGTFNEYLLKKTGKGISYKGDKIVESIYKEAVSRFGESSLLLPQAYKNYLLQYFFKNTNSAISNDTVRNASAHGRARDDAYTYEKTIIVILTLDQLFFFMERAE